MHVRAAFVVPICLLAVPAVLLGVGASADAGDPTEALRNVWPRGVPCGEGLRGAGRAALGTAVYAVIWTRQ